jgi:phenylacetic acid degradation operon negative regulatory protein
VAAPRGARPAPGSRSAPTAPTNSVRGVNDVLRRRSVGAPAARSTLLTVLGEYLLPRPEGVWQEALIGSLRLLGFTPSAARQAVVRSTREGWLEGERIGRRSRMRLTPSSAELLRDGARRIYEFGRPVGWDGRWMLIVLRVPEQRRELRHRLTTQLAWSGFGSLGGGLWITPHAGREDQIHAEEPAQLLSFRAELGALGDTAKVIQEAWDLPALRQHYEEFLADFAGDPDPASDNGAIFAAQTALVHAWRRFPFIDPDLPDDLLPADWPRPRAYELFHTRHERWAPAAQSHFDALAGA